MSFCFFFKALLFNLIFVKILPISSNVHFENDDLYWEKVSQEVRDDQDSLRKARAAIPQGTSTAPPHQGTYATPTSTGEQSFKISQITDLIDYDKDPTKLQQVTEFWLANNNSYDCREDNIGIFYDKGVGEEKKVKKFIYLTRKHRLSDVQKTLEVCQKVKR